MFDLLEDEDEMQGLLEEKLQLLKDRSEEEVEEAGEREANIERCKMFDVLYFVCCNWNATFWIE
jgi:hypothetical protein